ncbi:MAG: WG repeat-containing protein [Bacilli bacterium]|nr:WG repeat-containing protein [Bacilli bacterium]
MMEKIENINLDEVFNKQEDYIDDKAVGHYKNDGKLYLIDRKNKVAYLLPEKYQNTKIILYHPCGGYDDSGMIMVSLLGDIELSYYHDLSDTAGMWGWIDLDGNEVITPKYVYAMNFFGDYAIVCKGDWTVDSNGKYWCNNEQWGVIDKNEKEVVPIKYDDEITFVSEDKVAVKDGHFEDDKWIDGTWRVFDIKQGKEIFTTEDSLRYSEYKDGYLTICDSECHIYLYDFETDTYLFNGEKYDEIEIVGRDKFVKTKDDRSNN